MIIEFSCANFLSFKDRATFRLDASNDDALEESNVFQADKKRLVRSAVIYGANASGKSNLLHAIYFMRQMVLSSSKDTQADEEIDVDIFKLSTECEGKPSFFEIIFLQNGCTYRYGFEVDRKKVHSEWLFSVPSTREAELFVRENNQIQFNSSRFKEGRNLVEKTRGNALFLSVCAQFNGEVSKNLLSLFNNIGFFQGWRDYGLPIQTEFMLRRPGPKQKQRIMDLVHIADLCIDDLEVRREKIIPEHLPKYMPDEIKKDFFEKGVMLSGRLKTIHRKYGDDRKETGKVTFDLDEDESGGTQKYIYLAGYILDVLENGRIMVIDELDARLHPLLTQAIIKLFNSPLNRRNAQLVFATHDTNLLSNKFFRRDQIWFTEKDRYGATCLYSLDELKGVRKEASFGKDYILGKYGAIPFIGDPSGLFCEGGNE